MKWLDNLLRRRPKVVEAAKGIDPRAQARAEVHAQFIKELRKGGIGRNLLKNGRTR